MSNKAKALLDSLMGTTRDISKKDKTGDEFREEKICKHFLVGFCPDHRLGKLDTTGIRDRFESQDWRIVRCMKVHSLAMREEFEKHPQVETYRKDYERDFKKRLDELSQECAARTRREKYKCRPAEVVFQSTEKQKEKMDAWENERKAFLEEAEKKGAEGDVTGSKEAAHEAELRAVSVKAMKEDNTFDFPGEDVCKTCGVAYLKGQRNIILDKLPEKLQGAFPIEDEHFESKLHKVFLDITEKLAELNAKNRRGGTGPLVAEGSRNRGREGERQRSPDRGRGDAPERGRGGDVRDRGRDRGDRGRDDRGQRSRSRDRNCRSRSRRDRGRNDDRGR